MPAALQLLRRSPLCMSAFCVPSDPVRPAIPHAVKDQQARSADPRPMRWCCLAIVLPSPLLHRCPFVFNLIKFLNECVDDGTQCPEKPCGNTFVAYHHHHLIVVLQDCMLDPRRDIKVGIKWLSKPNLDATSPSSTMAHPQHNCVDVAVSRFNMRLACGHRCRCICHRLSLHCGSQLGTYIVWAFSMRSPAEV